MTMHSFSAEGVSDRVGSGPAPRVHRVITGRVPNPALLIRGMGPMTVTDENQSGHLSDSFRAEPGME